MFTNDYFIKFYTEDRQKAFINEAKLERFKKGHRESEKQAGFFVYLTKFLNKFRLPELNERNCNCTEM